MNFEAKEQEYARGYPMRDLSGDSTVSAWHLINDALRRSTFTS